MPRLKDELAALSAAWNNDDTSRIAHRAAQVQSEWKEVIGRVYKDLAPYVLAHVNAVYITEEEGRRALIVYLDDANFRADVHSRQHLICLRMREMFNEEIDDFRTFPSKFDMRRRHPYDTNPQNAAQPKPSRALTEEEISEVDQLVSGIEDQKLANAFRKAMISSRETEDSNISL